MLHSSPTAMEMIKERDRLSNADSTLANLNVQIIRDDGHTFRCIEVIVLQTPAQPQPLKIRMMEFVSMRRCTTVFSSLQSPKDLSKEMKSLSCSHNL